MKTFTIYDMNGEYLRHGSCPLNEFMAQVGTGEVIIEGLYPKTNYYMLNWEVVEKGNPPTEYHKWDSVSNSWVPTVAKAVYTIHKAIEKERDTRRFANITVDSITIQADEEAIRNIEKKQQHIGAKARLTSTLPVDQLFWRDAGNTIHTWANATAYATWLDNVVAALGDRETLIWAKSFIHKDNITTLGQENTETALNNILSYNITTGWE